MRHVARTALAAACLLIASMPAWSTPQTFTREEIAERIAAAQRPPAGWPALVVEARKYMGTNPTDRDRLWCATFMNLILGKLGYAGTNSDAAKSFAYYGRRISKPRIGAIAVLTRGKRGGHVGVVSGVAPGGNPIIISGNHNDRVGEGIYPRARVIAYVMPTERRNGATVQLAARSISSFISDAAINSPITELIAAIEAEHARAEKPARAAPHRRAAPRPPVRELVVQQLPDQDAPPPRPRAQAQGDSPLEPLLTSLFGPDDRPGAQSSRRAPVARVRYVPAGGLADIRR